MPRSNSSMPSTSARIALVGAALAAILGGVTGCRGQRSDDPPRQFLPDMDDQQKWRSQQRTEFFTDHRTMRQPVTGTVPFGEAFASTFAADRAEYLQEDDAFFLGLDAAGEPVAYIPQHAIELFRPVVNGEPGDDAAALAAMIQRGQERYNIYCAVCHGYAGDGRGLAGVRWAYPLPTYHDPKYQDRALPTGKDGHIFRVARWGIVDPTGPGRYKMPPYADKVSERDTWAIVAYIRVLQASWTSDLDALPPEKQSELLRQPRPEPAAPAETPEETPEGASEGTPPVSATETEHAQPVRIASGGASTSGGDR